MPTKVFEQIADQDFLIHHPFDSFTSVETFLRAAVDDPHVVAIKMTLYRIGANSPLVDLLIEAAERRQAGRGAGRAEGALRRAQQHRLGERGWKSAGIHVVYGLMNLKVHCKLCLVVRQETDGIRRYAHIATGNYNRITSQVYTDLGLFTADEAHPRRRDRGVQLADRLLEPALATTRCWSRRWGCARGSARSSSARWNTPRPAGRPRIIIKNNAVADPAMIKTLYRASQAGVPIDMIVRGVCCLRPGIPGISDRIRVRSIVGRFLEHSRIYYFENGGEPEVYIGSADLMERNLDRRVEVLCPVLDPDLRQHLRDAVLDALLRDTDRAWTLRTDGRTREPLPEGATPSIRRRPLLTLRPSGSLQTTCALAAALGQRLADHDHASSCGHAASARAIYRAREP